MTRQTTTGNLGKATGHMARTFSLKNSRAAADHESIRRLQGRLDFAAGQPRPRQRIGQIASQTPVSSPRQPLLPNNKLTISLNALFRPNFYSVTHLPLFIISLCSLY